MLRRDVVSCGSACAAFRNSAKAAASSPFARSSRPVARWATALFGLDVERLLREERRRLVLALGQVRERELGERRGVGRLADEHLARLGDRLVDLPALAERRDVERPRVDARSGGRRTKSAEAVGRELVLAAPAPDLRRAPRRPPASPGASLRGGRELLFGAREVAGAGEDDAEVVARLPEVRVERDGLAKERDRALPLTVLRGLNALHHLARPPPDSPADRRPRP